MFFLHVLFHHYGKNRYQTLRSENKFSFQKLIGFVGKVYKSLLKIKEKLSEILRKSKSH
jgi:hypothetical protein